MLSNPVAEKERVMKITIKYTLYPDKDFRLDNPKSFGGKWVDDLDSYVGKAKFKGENAELDAIKFLEKFVNEGIYCKDGYEYLLEDFYYIKSNLELFILGREEYYIEKRDNDTYIQTLEGNYKGTKFEVNIKE